MWTSGLLGVFRGSLGNRGVEHMWTQWVKVFSIWGTTGSHFMIDHPLVGVPNFDPDPDDASRVGDERTSDWMN